VRNAIYLRDTAIRIYSVSQLKSKTLFVKISSWAKIMSLEEYFCRPSQYWIFQIWPYPRQNPMSYVAAPGASLAGKPMGAQP
jgi:hypothetical protein